MKIGFQIPYHTAWGEHISATLTWRKKDGKAEQQVLELSTSDGETWRGETQAPTGATSVTCRYITEEAGQTKRCEWDMAPRVLTLPQGKNRVLCADRWRDQPHNNHRYTSAFTEAFTCRPLKEWPQPHAGKTLMLRVLAPEVPQGQVLAVLGNQSVVGEWQAGREVRMQPVAANEWAVCLDLEQTDGALEYKYLTIDETTGEQCAWELHDNRLRVIPNIEQKMVVVAEDEAVSLPFAPTRVAGCVIPVFSLRSEESFGVGDFGDLRRMVDWVALTGQRAVQVLPINDTTLTGQWTDSYPYNSISIYALHPMYACLKELPVLKNNKLRAAYEKIRKELNALRTLDYEKAVGTKRDYLHHLFLQEGEATLGTKSYKAFYEKNRHWLLPYAAFCYLRDLHGTPDFRHWEKMSQYDAKKVLRLTRKDAESAAHIAENCYIQFILHEQLTAVRQYARTKGVALKGDIPIGISPDSVEAWTEPHYFNLDGQAGAPPDYFSQNGQNWGFPTYNWEAMLADDCMWWRRRFEHMAEYFDAFRIDHVLGFFRIWEIPQDSVHGLLGHFSPAIPMSIDEIEGFGLPWREETYTQPYITDRIILQIFGEDTARVRHLYLDTQGNGRYTLKPEYDTQRKVQAAFEKMQNAKWKMQNGQESMSEKVRDGLYRLISNVLFLRDKKQPDHFHPRIVAMHDFLYEDLGDWEKDAFNRIHEHYFHHRHNQFWYEEAMKKLPTLVNATRMLVCAEDLGMIPECVGWVMNELGILSLEIQTMPKKAWVQFANLWENPYRSVATISTHDMPTMRQWWDEQRETVQQYYNNVLYHEGQAPHPMPGNVAEEIVSRHLESPSMLCLLSLQDWLAIDETLRNPTPEQERINIPSNPRHYWCYRMHLTLEQLMGSTALNEKIRGLVKSHGR